MNRTTLGTAIALLAILTTRLPTSAWLSAQSRETFSATATAGNTAESAVHITITFTIDRYTTEAEHMSLRSALNQGPSALQAALKAMPDIGVIIVADRRTALKYAYKPPQNGGQTITLLTAEPLAYLDPGLKDKPKEGYGLALAKLDFSPPGFAIGELDPAVKITINSAGMIETQEYGAAIVRLTNVERK